jgi:integrase
MSRPDYDLQWLELQAQMAKHYQDGYIRLALRKSVSPRWEFLWRENTETGKPVRRTIVIGTVEKYPTEELANAAINGLRLQLNSKRNRLMASKPLATISDLIDYYIVVELSPLNNWRSHATRTIYEYFLEKWIRPKWGAEPITGIRTVAIESWLKQLRRDNGEFLANATKAKIRSIFSVIFNHAIRCEWLEQGKILSRWCARAHDAESIQKYWILGKFRLYSSSFANPFD